MRLALEMFPCDFSLMHYGLRAAQPDPKAGQFSGFLLYFYDQLVRHFASRLGEEFGIEKPENDTRRADRLRVT